MWDGMLRAPTAHDFNQLVEVVRLLAATIDRLEARIVVLEGREVS